MENIPELTRLVKAEAKNLKKFATPEELNRLNFTKLQPLFPTDDIYGQMTGYCYSVRATILIQNCAPKVLEQIENLDLYKCKINGKPNFNTEEANRNGNYWSPIECFITNPINKNTANHKLISYLKGETKTLDI